MSEVCLSTAIRFGPPWLGWVSPPRHIHRRPLDLRDDALSFFFYILFYFLCYLVVCDSVTGLVVSYAPVLSSPFC